MRTVSIQPDFVSWRSVVRGLLAEKVHPADVLWSVGRQDELFAFDTMSLSSQRTPRLKVPKAFVRLAETVSCHRSGQQWAMLYHILWTMIHGGDRAILENTTNSTVRKLEKMRATVSRDIHKMRAFVRFRKVENALDAEPCLDKRESYVAWYEPEHLIVRTNVPFFRKRFAGMCWSILTPDECAHWDGEQVHFTDGVDQSQAPSKDQLESLWLGYYRSIFNPARLKIKMMQTEMPKKYWKNLPEAELIEDLIRGSAEQVQEMMQEENRPLKPVPDNEYLKHLEGLNKQ